MAYPTVSAGYGFRPVNLHGGRVYSGSTRMIPIAQAYNTNIFNGDPVGLAAGSLIKSGIIYSTSLYVAGTIGVFVGAEYTTTSGPIYGKNRYQYWPANTVAQDAVGYVVDDPQALFRTAVYAQASGAASSTPSALGYASPAFVGTGVNPVNIGVGSTATGDSTAGVSTIAAPTNGSGLVRNTAGSLRIVQLVPDTAVTLSGTGTSSSTTVTLTSAVTGLQAGMQIIVANTAGTGYTTGGYPGDNNYITNVNGTTVTIANAITAASTVNMTFIGYPEVVVGWAGTYHSYMNAAGV